MVLKSASKYLPHGRVFNFSAGPGSLPTNVLEKVQSELLNYRGTGMSVMEMSHRDVDGPIQTIVAEAEHLVRELLDVPDNYHVLFMQGGAHGQFAALPLNLAYENPKVDYIDMGVWSAKAMLEAKRMVDVNVPYTGTTTIETPKVWQYRQDAAYIHLCLNETLSGLEVFEDFDLGVDAPPIATDATSTLFSRPIDVSKYGVIYASAGKNMGPAGVCLIIVRQDLLERQPHPCLPSIIDYRVQANTKPIPSIYQTPPCFALYVVKEVLQDLKTKGGVKAMALQAKARAQRIYELLDLSDGFYQNEVDERYRSRMNICFKICGGRSPEAKALEDKFVAGSEAAGMTQLFMHPQYGGLRISLYNALPDAAIDAVCDYLIQFKSENL